MAVSRPAPPTLAQEISSISHNHCLSFLVFAQFTFQFLTFTVEPPNHLNPIPAIIQIPSPQGSPPPNPMKQDCPYFDLEADRRQSRIQKNRLSAERSRQKKFDRISELEQEVSLCEQRCQELEDMLHTSFPSHNRAFIDYHIQVLRDQQVNMCPSSSSLTACPSSSSQVLVESSLPCSNTVSSSVSVCPHAHSCSSSLSSSSHGPSTSHSLNPSASLSSSTTSLLLTMDEDEPAVFYLSL